METTSLKDQGSLHRISWNIKKPKQTKKLKAATSGDTQ